MKFRFPATTPALDHEIGARLNAQARSHIAPDMAIWRVEVLEPWRQDGDSWTAEVEALVSDGRELSESLMTGSDASRIEGKA